MRPSDPADPPRDPADPPREPAAPGTAPVAIAVVSWNTRDLLRACLASIEPEVAAGRAEAWVVDNASSDGSAEMVRDAFPWVHLIASAENLGFGPAVNLVAGRTASGWIAIANADVELRPGTLETLLRAGERDPSAGLLAPRLVLPSGETQHSAYHFPRLGFTLVFNLGVPMLSRRLAARMLLEGHWQGDRARTVDWALGAFLLARREAWEAVGGFDPEQWMYAEDLDLAWRVAQAGWHTRFEPGAPVLHHGAAATSQLWGDDRDVRWQRSTYAWMLRRRGTAITRGYGLINTAGAAARVAVYSLPVPARFAGTVAYRRAANRHWLRLHAGNLLASRTSLREHR
jgi:N-acetylglucosaminyl-diphospho-decaprenol L-rhamnosyltransferase